VSLGVPKDDGVAVLFNVSGRVGGKVIASGEAVGLFVSPDVPVAVGALVSRFEGSLVGAPPKVGTAVASAVSPEVGATVAPAVSLRVGTAVGAAISPRVGDKVGAVVSLTVGLAVVGVTGAGVGRFVLPFRLVGEGVPSVDGPLVDGADVRSLRVVGRLVVGRLVRFLLFLVGAEVGMPIVGA